jgi:HK97 family phage prohead protease
MTTRLIRSAPKGSIRAVEVDGKPGVRLQILTYRVVDSWGSLWLPGCLDETLNERMPQICWAHQWEEPLGRGFKWEPGDSGPFVEFYFDDFDAVPEARRAYAQVQSGTIDDCSVGFDWDYRWRPPTDEEKALYPGVREVIERAELNEVSLVLRGAVPGAKVLAYRSHNLKPRRERFVSEDDSARILQAALEAVQNGVPKTDALLAALQDIKEVSVEQVGTQAEESKEDEPAKTGDENDDGTEGEQAAAKESEEGTTEESGDEEAEEQGVAAASTEETEEAAGDAGGETEAQADAEGQQSDEAADAVVDEELEALLAASDELLSDHLDTWQISAPAAAEESAGAQVA